MKIVTEHVYPPIPIRSMDWMAYDDDTYCGCGEGCDATGCGPTELAAIEDFIESLEMRGTQEAELAEARSQLKARITNLHTFTDSGTRNKQ